MVKVKVQSWSSYLASCLQRRKPQSKNPLSTIYESPYDPDAFFSCVVIMVTKVGTWFERMHVTVQSSAVLLMLTRSAVGWVRCRLLSVWSDFCCLKSWRWCEVYGRVGFRNFGCACFIYRGCLICLIVDEEYIVWIIKLFINR